MSDVAHIGLFDADALEPDEIRRQPDQVDQDPGRESAGRADDDRHGNQFQHAPVGGEIG
jgi:hypothetical protein